MVGAKAGRAESENCHEIESSIKWNSINTIGGDLSHSGKKMDIWDGNQSCPGPGSQAESRKHPHADWRVGTLSFSTREQPSETPGKSILHRTLNGMELQTRL